MHTLHGMACAPAVIPGNVNDSPHLRAMATALPEGDGDDPASAAHGGIKNCNAIRDSGRRAFINVKSNAVIKGFSARAEMMRFGGEHPGTFRILRLRNNVESVFSSMNAWFGVVVRVLKEKTRSAKLLSMTVCYNMAFT